MGGLAVVGSRDASEEDIEFARSVAAACALQNIPVISGGARGVDRDGAVGAVPHRARLDDAFLGEADAAAGRGLGEQSQVLEAQDQFAAGPGVRGGAGNSRAGALAAPRRVE